MSQMTQEICKSAYVFAIAIIILKNINVFSLLKYYAQLCAIVLYVPTDLNILSLIHSCTQCFHSVKVTKPPQFSLFHV
jgi:hypothetical protein